MTEHSSFKSVPIEIKVCVGHARPKLQDLETLAIETVLPLDRRVEDPVDLFVGDTLIARGELHQLEDSRGQIGVRLTEVFCSPDQGPVD